MTVAQMPSEVARRIFDLLNDEKEALVTSGGQILYGDQGRVGTTPTVCVEAGTTTRVLGGVGGSGRTENQLSCFIIIYYARVDSNQSTKPEAEKCAEDIVYYLDQNTTLERDNDGGVVIHGFVSSVEPGYSRKGDTSTLLHTVRLTWTGKSKTILGA